MSEYPHLRLPYRVEGLHKGSGRSKPEQTRTTENKANRSRHGNSLLQSLGNLKNTWTELKNQKDEGSIALPNSNAVPLFLKIDANVFRDIDSFRHWGIEIVSEEENGFIIGVSNDDFAQFEENLRQFLEQEGRYKDTASKIWEISIDDNWRIELLLKGDLKSVWGSIEDERIYTVEIGVFCGVINPKPFPERHKFDEEEKYEEKLAEFQQGELAAALLRDESQREREEEIEKLLNFYGGTLHEEWDNGQDAVFFKLSVKGSGLRELVLRYQYLFKVSFPAQYNIAAESSVLPDGIEIELQEPDADAPSVCVVDSGIQESHILLRKAIDGTRSKSYVRGDSSTADHVRRAGHGTKVAGVILYPQGIPRTGAHKLGCRILNARILDNDNSISVERFAPALMEQIVDEFKDSRIFNLSVAEKYPYDGTHMHELAQSIDKLTYENDILFVIAVGNIDETTGDNSKPGINDLLGAGIGYPDFLNHPNCRIACPGISLFGLSVGSVGHNNFEDENDKAVAGQDFVSPFSRSGFGLWGSIKPDVVEYGGDLVLSKSVNTVKVHPETCHELVNSTLHGASAIGKDSYGTSFSTPKVSYICSRLQAEHPTETAQMYRALIVQSARLPWHCADNPRTIDFQHYGYGIPSLDRALNNTPNRVTFIQNGRLGGKKADIYRLMIPSELRGEGKDFDVLVEITLAFTAPTRVTRKGNHSYLGTWLEWKSSNIRENFNSFRNRTHQFLEADDVDDVEEGDNPINWTIRENSRYSSDVKISRNYSTVQKSWVKLKPFQLTDDFSIAVIGHIGWNKDLSKQVPYALCVSFEIAESELPVYSLMAEAQVTIPDIEVEV